MILSGFRVRITTACVMVALAASGCGIGSTGSDATTTATSPPPAPSVSSATATAPSTTPATTLPPATPPPPGSTPATDWANFEYQSVECGTITPITLTDGSFVSKEDYVSVTLGESVQLDSGNTAVTLYCLVGPSGDSGGTELLLFGPDGNELAHEEIPRGEPTINPDGTGSVEYDVYAPDDPRCCPSGKETVSITITDDTILIATP